MYLIPDKYTESVFYTRHLYMSCYTNVYCIQKTEINQTCYPILPFFTLQILKVNEIAIICIRRGNPCDWFTYGVRKYVCRAALKPIGLIVPT